MTSLEVGVVKMMVQPVGGFVSVANRRVDFFKSVQVELAHEAREIGGLKGVGAVGGSGGGGQDAGLEELLIDDDHLAEAVPADGPIGRAVHQTPEFGRKNVGVDVAWAGMVGISHVFTC